MLNTNHVFAQESIDPTVEAGYEVFVSPILFDVEALDQQVQTDFQLPTIAPEELTMLRASGIDPSWVRERFQLPTFTPSLRRATQSDHPSTVESWVLHHSPDSSMLALHDTLQFKVGRTTDLSDGNIAGSKGGLGGSGDDHIASIAQQDGEYDLYDLSLQWDAVDAGPLKLSVLSGFKAIEANITKRTTDDSGTTSLDNIHEVAALPMVGSGMSWQISENFSIRGAALTHPVSSGDALLDLNAATDLRITRNVGFVAGYRVIRSSFEVGNSDTELTQEGLFARLQISF